MALKIYKALTPSMRFKRIIEKKDLWKGKSLKKLTFRLKSTGGRNASGKITWYLFCYCFCYFMLI